MIEIWHPVSGFEYEVSNLGRVRSLSRWSDVAAGGNKKAYRRTLVGRVLKLHRHLNGYLSARLHPGEQMMMVSRLVCEVFHGAAPSPEHHADHINGARDDNRAENLRWLPRAENLQSRATARGENAGPSRLTEASVKEIYVRSQNVEQVTASDIALAAEFGVTRESVRNIRIHRTWVHITIRPQGMSQ